MTLLLRQLAPILCLALALALPGLALAQTAPEPTESQGTPANEEIAAARRLFDQALELEKTDDWAAALAKLDKVKQVKMTPQVRFHIALCHEHLGRLVEAINGFELAAQEARAPGSKSAAVADNAPVRAEALRGRVAHVTLRVNGKVRTSKIFIDGRSMSLALVDTDLPLDPGSHRIEVRRGDELIEGHDLELDEAELETVDLTIDDPEPPPPKPEPGGVAPPTPPAGDGPPADQPSRVPAYLIAGAGVAILGGAAVLFALREATLANVRCADIDNLTGCNPGDRDTVDLARQYDVASKVALGVGAAAVAAGVVLWFVLAPEDDPAPPASGSKRAAANAPRVGIEPTLGGLRVLGAF